MTNQPLVSIALCTFNGEKFLREQLDTLVNQTYANLEIIAVDDCSIDTTLTILTAYQRSYPNLKVFQNESNLGFVKNFEKAIGLCSGELIALSDQDDIWDLEKIALLTEALDDNILVYHDSALIDATGHAIGKNVSDRFNMFSGTDARKLLLFNCISGHAMLFRSTLINYLLPFKKQFLHDWWIAYVAANLGSVGYMPNRLIKFRQHYNSQTDIFNYKKKNRTVWLTSEWLQLCRSFPQNRYQEFVDELAALYRKSVISWFRPDLSTFIFFNKTILLALQKKSEASKLNYIYKTIWGRKWKH